MNLTSSFLALVFVFAAAATANALPADVSSALDLYIATKTTEIRTQSEAHSPLANFRQRSSDVEAKVDSLYGFIRNAKAQMSFANQDLTDRISAINNPKANPYHDPEWLKSTKKQLTSTCCEQMRSSIREQRRLLRRGRSGGFSRREGR